MRVAVATNFVNVAEALAERFEADTGHHIVLSPGSTGKHYAQIVHGAPFDVFLAADAERPELLEGAGRAVAGSRFTYAVGRLVLWSSDPELVDLEGRVLHDGGFRRLAIANPDLAPYGRAAREVLVARGLWDRWSANLVRGENIGQTFQFVASGNAELGFVAYSQVTQQGRSRAGSLWKIPTELHSPIEQQAVLLSDTDPARAFLAFVQGVEARAIIRDHGYDIPADAE